MPISDYIGGAIITGAANLLGGTMSSAANASAAREYNRGQMELAKYQNEWNLAQWERENAYNSPSQQMQRFREAGLNPNLIYGQQNLSASSPSAAHPDLKPVPRNNGMAKFLENLDLRNIMMDIDLKEAQMNLLQSQSGYYQEQAGKVASEKERNTIFNNLYGTDEYATNFQDLNQISTDRASLEYQRAVSEFNGLNGDPESMSYWELLRNEQVWNNGLRKLQYNLTNEYGAKHEEAVIYNLIYGNKAAQTSAAASMVMANVASDRLGLDERKYNDVRDLIISHYGYENLEKSWSALYVMKKYFGTTFDNILNKEKFNWEQLKTLIDLGKFAVKQQSDNASQIFKLFF